MSRIPEPAELADDFARLERAVEASAQSTRDAIDRLITEMKREYVRKDVYDVHRHVTDKRLGEIEGGQKWVVRTTVAALVFPLLVALVVFVIFGGPT